MHEQTANWDLLFTIMKDEKGRIAGKAEIGEITPAMIAGAMTVLIDLSLKSIPDSQQNDWEETILVYFMAMLETRHGYTETVKILN